MPCCKHHQLEPRRMHTNVFMVTLTCRALGKALPGLGVTASAERTAFRVFREGISIDKQIFICILIRGSGPRIQWGDIVFCCESFNNPSQFFSNQLNLPCRPLVYSPCHGRCRGECLLINPIPGSLFESLICSKA